MLTIRMQRTGRKGFATFRVVVQDSRFSPTSGRVVAQVGHSNPHTKETVLNLDKIQEYIKNGAQPSPRVVRLLEAEKVKLPDWVKKSDKSGKRKTRNPEKLRKNRPEEEAKSEGDTEAPDAEPVASESPVDAAEDTSAEETAPAEEKSVPESAEEPSEAQNAEEVSATDEATTDEATSESNDKPTEA